MHGIPAQGVDLRGPIHPPAHCFAFGVFGIERGEASRRLKTKASGNRQIRTEVIIQTRIKTIYLIV